MPVNALLCDHSLRSICLGGTYVNYVSGILGKISLLHSYLLERCSILISFGISLASSPLWKYLSLLLLGSLGPSFTVSQWLMENAGNTQTRWWQFRMFLSGIFCLSLLSFSLISFPTCSNRQKVNQQVCRASCRSTRKWDASLPLLHLQLVLIVSGPPEGCLSCFNLGKILWSPFQANYS